MLNFALLEDVLGQTGQDLEALLTGPAKGHDIAAPVADLYDAVMDADTALGKLWLSSDPHEIATDQTRMSSGFRAAVVLIDRAKTLSEHDDDPDRFERTIRLCAVQALKEIPLHEWEGFFSRLFPVLHEINRGRERPEYAGPEANDEETVLEAAVAVTN